MFRVLQRPKTESRTQLIHINKTWLKLTGDTKFGIEPQDLKLYCFLMSNVGMKRKRKMKLKAHHLNVALTLFIYLNVFIWFLYVLFSYLIDWLTHLYSPCWVGHHVAPVKGVDGCGRVKRASVPREDGHPTIEQHFTLRGEMDKCELKHRERRCQR